MRGCRLTDSLERLHTTMMLPLEHLGQHTESESYRSISDTTITGLWKQIFNRQWQTREVEDCASYLQSCEGRPTMLWECHYVRVYVCCLMRRPQMRRMPFNPLKWRQIKFGMQHGVTKITYHNVATQHKNIPLNLPHIWTRD